jgi:hypothetical protein
MNDYLEMSSAGWLNLTAKALADFLTEVLNGGQRTQASE